MAIIKRYYGKAFRTLLWAVNPIKKRIIIAECRVHRFINYKAVKLLYKFKYEDEYKFFNLYLEELNRGVVWADQDLKSAGHFYNPIKKRGLYGHTDALTLTKNYYDNAIDYWNKNDIKKAVFFLGACVHLIQDMTIPQHVNIRLFDSHRKYENFVKLTYGIVTEYTSYEEPIVFDTLEHFLKFNTKKALSIYKQVQEIDNDINKFHEITLCILPLAQRSTAGCLIKFLKDVSYLRPL